MLCEQQVLNLVGKIYDASLDASRWPTLLSPLTEAFDGNTAYLFEYDLTNKATRSIAFHNMFFSTFTDYASYYWKKDIWSLSPAVMQ